MNKRLLAKELANKTGIKYISAVEIVNVTFDILRESLEKEEPIIIHGFGSFNVRDFNERRGINPNTLEIMKISACKKVKFTQSKMINLTK